MRPPTVETTATYCPSFRRIGPSEIQREGARCLPDAVMTPTSISSATIVHVGQSQPARRRDHVDLLQDFQASRVTGLRATVQAPLKRRTGVNRLVASSDLGGALGGFGPETLGTLADVENEAGVGAARDRLQVVLGGNVEGYLAALDRRHRGRDLDVHADQGRGEVTDADLHSDRILVGVGVPEQEVAAGLLDVADEKRRGVDAALFSHELDAAVAVDHQPLDVRHSWTKALFHCDSLPAQPADR